MVAPCSAYMLACACVACASAGACAGAGTRAGTRAGACARARGLEPASGCVRVRARTLCVCVSVCMCARIRQTQVMQQRSDIYSNMLLLCKICDLRNLKCEHVHARILRQGSLDFPFQALINILVASLETATFYFLEFPRRDLARKPCPSVAQGSGCIIHLNIATCKWCFPFILAWRKKPHVSNGCTF